MESRAFVIPIHDLDEGGQSSRFRVPLAWIRTALEGCEMQPCGQDGEIDVHVSRTGQDVLVRGTIRVDLAVPCARCLATVPIRPSVDLSLVLEPAQAPLPKQKGASAGHAERRKPRAEEPEFDADAAARDTYEGEQVVLDRFVREALLLEAPIFPLCSETCEGIRPSQTQSAPPRADPRLAKLFELAKKRTTKE